MGDSHVIIEEIPQTETTEQITWSRYDFDETLLASGTLDLDDHRMAYVYLSEPARDTDHFRFIFRGETYERWVVSSQAPFIPGDTNGDKSINLTDAINLLNYLFGSGFPEGMEDKLYQYDVTGDGAVNLSDAIRILSYLFQGDDPPAHWAKVANTWNASLNVAQAGLVGEGGPDADTCPNPPEEDGEEEGQNSCPTYSCVDEKCPLIYPGKGVPMIELLSKKPYPDPARFRFNFRGKDVGDKNGVACGLYRIKVVGGTHHNYYCPAEKLTTYVDIGCDELSCTKDFASFSWEFDIEAPKPPPDDPNESDPYQLPMGFDSYGEPHFLLNSERGTMKVFHITIMDCSGNEMNHDVVVIRFEKPQGEKGSAFRYSISPTYTVCNKFRFF